MGGEGEVSNCASALNILNQMIPSCAFFLQVVMTP